MIASLHVITLLLNLFKDFSMVVGSALIGILGLLAALLGLAWGVRAFMRHGVQGGYFIGSKSNGTWRRISKHDYDIYRGGLGF